ncbi:Transposon Tf2-11 polyprotein [Eumeta japonica]|uniref:Transposon Tf2-11 polyprotein n=1 Tax=Eumeta variegata TaxID=151549 RepID=A0A4C1XNV6_EUMVA|nr:Transposon Tf2-11 polyprotein [Eumeta japonica]
MCREKGDARASHYLAAELAGDVEGNKKCYNIKCVNGSPLFVVVTLNRLSIECEVDSGSAVSAMSNTFYTAYFKHQALSRINGSLRCYDGSPITPRGSCSLSVTYRGRTKQIKFYIIDNGCHVQPAPILGRDFMSEFNLGISEMKYIDNPINLKSVNYSDYATPITPVLKSDGTVRVCGDYSVTLNKVLHIDRYPLPRIEELFARLHEGKEFSKLDLSMAYMQLELTEDSQPLTCINTHRGLSNLHDWFWVIVGACDISKNNGTNSGRHRRNILQEAGLTLQKEKCVFFQKSIEYLGFVIDKDGLHTSPGKVKAIKEAEPPKNVSQLKSFLGLVNYYRSFVPRMSTILGPLHDLLKMGAKWMWSEAHQSAFETVKRALESELALAHYDPRLSTVLTVDASPTGLGAVLAQQQEDGSERVIAFASRALTPSERVYSQIQKEATAIIFGVKKFHQYLYGRADPFVLKTDHKPLLSIFGNKKGIPEMTANRLQRYALFLSAYNYTVQYVRSANNVADYLSRSHPQARAAADGSGAGTCAASVDVEDGEINTYLHFISSNDQSSITIKEIKVETQNDPMLHSVVLVARDRCGHRERSGRVRACTALRPARPWERVHLDMLSVAGGTHLVVVDAHSKWVEWAPLADGAGTEPVLRRLSEMLGRFGLPRTIVTDNATPFTSARFRRYCEVNDIKHVTIPPYHPASNGQAEITVKLIKKALKTLMSETNSVSSLEHQVNKYLLSYRNSVHSTTGVSPAQLMLGRNVRTRLDLLCPRKDVPKHVAPAPSAANLAQSVSRSQISQSKYFGGKRKINFTVGDKVIVKRHYQNVSKETRRSVITLARWRRRLHSGHPQAAYEHYNSDESDDDYTFVKCSPMLMTERGRRKSKPRQHEARIVRTKGSLPKIAARS